MQNHRNTSFKILENYIFKGEIEPGVENKKTQIYAKRITKPLTRKVQIYNFFLAKRNKTFKN